MDDGAIGEGDDGSGLSLADLSEEERSLLLMLIAIVCMLCCLLFILVAVLAQRRKNAAKARDQERQSLVNADGGTPMAGTNYGDMGSGNTASSGTLESIQKQGYAPGPAGPEKGTKNEMQCALFFS